MKALFPSGYRLSLRTRGFDLEPFDKDKGLGVRLASEADRSSQPSPVNVRGRGRRQGRSFRDPKPWSGIYPSYSESTVRRLDSNQRERLTSGNASSSRESGTGRYAVTSEDFRPLENPRKRAQRYCWSVLQYQRLY